MRQVVAVSLIVLALAGCVRPGGPDGPGQDPGDGPDAIDQPAGPVVPLGEVPLEGTGERIRFEGFRNAEGGVCIRSSDGGMSCSGQSPATAPTLPATSPVELGWGGSDDQLCVEAVLQDGVARAVVVDAEGTAHELVELAPARRLGMALFVACWAGGAEPRRLDVTSGDGQLAYTLDM
jgi:hypothetical protein